MLCIPHKCQEKDIMFWFCYGCFVYYVLAGNSAREVFHHALENKRHSGPRSAKQQITDFLLQSYCWKSIN